MALSVIGTLRGRLLARDAVSSKGKRASARNTMKATNNQSLQSFVTIEPHNAIVIIQTTQAAFRKQRKRDSANNASVIMANRRAHNAIVISRFPRQVFVTFRNISSAYLSHKASLFSTLVLCDTSELALVRMYYSTPVLLCLYAHIIISLYDHMPIAAYNGSVMKRYKEAENQPCPKEAENQPCPIFFQTNQKLAVSNFS
jgi:hypothetical protein